MLGFLIDPEARAITEVDYDGDYKSIYKLIDAEGFDMVRLNEVGDAIFVDDIGLMTDKPFFKFSNYPNPLAGKGLVLGCDVHGESISPQQVTLEDLENQVTFISPARALLMAEITDAIAKTQEGVIHIPSAELIRDRYRG